MQQATVYVGHDTDFDLVVQDKYGVLVDFPSGFVITRAKLIFAGLIFDSASDASIFDWTTAGASGVVNVNLTGYAIPKGTYGARFVGYSTTYPNGKVLCTFQIVVDEELTGVAPSATALKAYLLDKENADHSTSGTGEDDLASYVMPAGTMRATGALRIFAAFTMAGTNGTKTLNLRFGATQIPLLVAAPAIVSDVFVDVLICNTAAGAQRILWRSDSSNTANRPVGYNETTIDTTAAVTVKFTGECAHASDTITQKMMVTELLP